MINNLYLDTLLPTDIFKTSYITFDLVIILCIVQMLNTNSEKQKSYS